MGRRRVLLVEDDEDDYLLTRRLLAQVPGVDFDVEWAADFDAALEALAGRRHDVALIDHRLGAGLGTDLIREAVRRGCTLPLILLTAQGDRETDVAAMEAGAADFLVKGRIDPPLIERALRYALDRGRAEEELRRARDELEDRVRERTAELAAANQALLAQVAERARAEREVSDLNAELERRVRRLAALRRIDLAITASLDLRVTLDVLLDQVTAQLDVHAAAVLLLEPPAQDLACAAARGFRTGGMSRSRLRAGQGYAGRAVLGRRLIHVPDLAAAGPGFLRAPLRDGEGFVAYYGVPLVAKGEVKGVLEVFHRAPLEPDAEWLEFLEVLAGQAAIAVDNAALFAGLQRSNQELAVAYDATIEGWASALDLRDKETEGHTRRVTEMAVRLARAMGVGPADLAHLRRGALLHDIGKLGIPDAILLKPDGLTDAERQVMRRHPEYAHEWLASIAFLRPAIEIPYCHHERWDGTGYPRGLKGEQIPRSARIFAAVDVWDALRSDRPYRRGWPEGRVVEHLRSLSGTHLDPRVADAFLRLLAEDESGDRRPGEEGEGPEGPRPRPVDARRRHRLDPPRSRA